MKGKILSFIVPVYNGEKYIEDCVCQLLKNQNQKEYEIILINDGSTDTSWKIIDSLARKYPDIVRAENTENGGVSRARNRGLEMARGDYVSFVDVDDFVADDFMGLLKEVLNRKPECDIVFFMWERVYDRDYKKCVREKENTYLEFDSNQRNILIKNLLFPVDDKFMSSTLFSPCGKVIRRDFLLANGIFFDTDMSIAEDVCWNIACLKSYKKIVYSPQTVYFYYHNCNSSGSRYNSYAETLGIDSNLKIEQILGELLAETEIRIANAYSILYRYWWCVVADYYHMDNHDKISIRAKRMKKLKNAECYKKAFEMLDKKMYEVMALNQRIVMKLVANDRFIFASIVCKLRIMLKKMRIKVNLFMRNSKKN